MATFLLIIADMIIPQLTRVVIDDVIRGGKVDLLKNTLIFILGIGFVKAIAGYIREYMYDEGGSMVALSLRHDLFKHIASLPFGFFDGMNTGELMSRTSEDVENIRFTVGFGLGFMIEQLIYFIAALGMMFTINIELTLLIIAVLPLLGYNAIRLDRTVTKAYEEISDQMATLNTTAQENLSGVRLVKSFGREKHEIEKFHKQNDISYELNLKKGKVLGKYYPQAEFLSNLLLVIIISYGGSKVIGANISLGELVAFNGYIWLLIWPVRLMGWLTNTLAQANASVKKIYKIMDTKSEILSPKVTTDFEVAGRVTFEGVSFSYGDKDVLKDINIDARPGSSVAIMGTTGAGKSSIINLIGRFYDVKAGKVMIDGVDVRDMELKNLRKSIAVVMQDTFLFSDTIKENIKFGKNSASMEEIESTSKRSRVDDFVNEVDKGYDTVIGERGTGLSGGQKQRISIARALLKEAKILILDDATSALDMETEHEIQKSLENNKDQTKFIIAHRISAVKNADQILIIEDGEIVERGTHSELVALGGKYYEIYEDQFSDVLGEELKEVV